MEERSPPVAGVQPHDLVEFLPREAAVGPGARQRRVQAVLVPDPGHALGDDLLGQDVERPRCDRRAVEERPPDTAEERGRFQELVEGERKEAALGYATERMARPPDALQEGRDRARGPHLNDEIHLAHVDAELEGRRGHQGAKRSGLESPLGVQTSLLREAAVVARDRLFAQDPGEVGGDALRHLPRVHEDEGRPMALDQLG